MKTRSLHLTFSLAVIAATGAISSLSAACGGACACRVAPTDATPGAVTLSAETQALLLAQLADEGLAAEVYRGLGEHFSLHPFQNIPRAEDNHAAALRALLTAAGIDNLPTTRSAAMRPRRDALIEQGSQSEIEALRVGALLEEQDITDLRNLARQLPEDAAIALIQQLESGSHRHLNAFVRNLKKRGVAYVPQVLSQTDFDAIITTASPGHLPGPGRGMNRRNS
jgi:hypothetical protein